MKRVAKKLALFIASSTYVFLLFMTAALVAMFFTLREPDTLKEWLDDSGVYTNIVGEISKLATIQQQQENSVVQITSEDIRSTALQVFSPESLQSDAELVIDGFYGWFKGDTAGPQFTVDFSGRQALFATAMRVKLEQKINQLPECESAGRFSVQAFDPFKSDCRPKDVDLTEELSMFEKEVAESREVLSQVRFTEDDLMISQNGEPRSVETVLSWVPRAYKVLLYGPWLIAGFAVITGLTIFLLSSSKRKGARRVAGGLFFSGVILILSGIFLGPAFDRVNSWSTQSLGSDASVTQNIVDPLFREINKSFSTFSIYFGIGYLIPALVIYGTLLLTRGKKTEAEYDAESRDQHTAPYLEEQETPTDPVATPVSTPEQPVTNQTPPEPKGDTPSPLPRPQTGRVYTRRPPRIQG